MSQLLLNIFALFNVVVCISVITLVIWQSNQQRSFSKVFFAFLSLLFFVLIWQVIGQSQLGQISVLLLLVILLYQLVVSHNTSKNPTLEFDHSIIITQAKEQERSRIYANLHDDVGAKLLELVYSAQDDKTKGLAKEVLSNIRQAVASTVNIQCTVQQLADEILNESKLRLDAAGLNLIQNITLEDGKQRLSAAIPSVVSRILREVLSNVIKHSKSKKVKISVISTQQYLKFSIHDDGIGFKTGNNNGKGLKTITKRAQSISADVEWKTGFNQGTQFILDYKYAHK